jgi:Ca2+-binding RTX toxin-like protein
MGHKMTTINGTSSGETLNGTSNSDVISGLGGNDTLYGYDGADTLYGNDGNDTLLGGTDTNTLYGGAGNDIFQMSARFTGYIDGLGYTGRLDVIADFTTGDKVDVSAYGISSFDQLKLIFETKNGTDAYFNAYYYGENHAVQFTKVDVSKLKATDFIYDTQLEKDETGTSYNDRLFGSTSGDTLNGADGSDQLFGGNGNDTLLGGTDTNTLYGGAGNDIFQMSARFTGYIDGLGYTGRLDVIADFTTGDKVDVSAYGISSFDQLKLIFETKNGTDAYFNAYYYGENHAVQFTKVAASKLTANDFIFDAQGAKDETGTSYDDRVFGSTSGDTLNGADGNDQLFGGNGNDTLLGGTDTNTLYGGAGNDIFQMSARFTGYIDGLGYTGRLDVIADFTTGDKVDVSAYGISSFDQLKLIFETKNGTDAYFNAYYYGENHAVQFTKVAASKLTANDFIFDAQGAKDETGTSYDDRVFGSTSGDTLNGADGNDQLFGGNGNDTLLGGTDTNTLYGGAGNDIFQMSARFTGYIDGLGYTGRLDVIADFTTGDKVDVSAYGISSFDQLKLIFETKNGTDAYFNAYYYGENHAVQFTKVDVSKLKATDFIYDTQLEKDETGTSYNDRLFGSTSGDTLNGADGSDQLFGGNGNDTLLGGTDTNTLYGGAGNDIFQMSARFTGYIDGLGYTGRLDVIADFTTGDKVDVSAYSISSFDQLKLIFETKNGTDAYFNAYYYGENHAVQFTKVDVSKLKATDFIYDTQLEKDETGTSYNDRLFGSTSGDTLNGADGSDQLFGGNGNDTLYGGSGEDWLYGQAGNDTMIGGYGDDVYNVTETGDIIDESSGDGVDEVRSTISLSISSSSRVLGAIENLTLIGSGTINGTGNSLANVITGNTGNNILDGKAGADTLTGGKGNDTYIVDNAGDKVIEKASEGTDPRKGICQPYPRYQCREPDADGLCRHQRSRQQPRQRHHRQHRQQHPRRQGRRRHAHRRQGQRYLHCR